MPDTENTKSLGELVKEGLRVSRELELEGHSEAAQNVLLSTQVVLGLHTVALLEQIAGKLGVDTPL